jgi:hypothetical protein
VRLFLSLWCLFLIFWSLFFNLWFVFFHGQVAFGHIEIAWLVNGMVGWTCLEAWFGGEDTWNRNLRAWLDDREAGF